MVALGLPLLAAKILWLLPAAVSTKVLGLIALRLEQVADAAIEGFIALLLAGLAFGQLGIPVVWKVPFLLIVVASLWYWAKDATYKIWPSMAGIVLGFVYFPKVLHWLSIPLTQRLGS